MKTQSLPNLTAINRQLVGEVNRVMKFILSLPFHVDNLLAATKAQDWAEVERQCEVLAVAGDACDLRGIAAAAKAVQQAIDDHDHLLARRAIVRLAARCGTVKVPTTKPNAKLN
jgi:hypothetical protein